MTQPSLRLTPLANRRVVRLEATFRIEAPMFSGGADPKGAPELRVPAFKGLLRWWWRALAWSRAEYGRELARLQRREHELFGSASGGQGRFSVSLRSSGVSSEWTARLGAGTTYLAGQGLAKVGGELSRRAFAPGASFVLGLEFGAGASAADVTEIEEALRVMGCLGGLGARTRRGLGSVRLVGFSKQGRAESSGATVEEVAATLRPILKRAAGVATEPPYTAFWQGTRIVLLRGAKGGAVELLEVIGAELLRYRAYGASTMGGRNTLGEDGERNFAGDHDLAWGALHQKNPTRAPARVAFGLPHNYFFSSIQQGPKTVAVEPGAGTGVDRRASPLLIHVHEDDAGRGVGALAFFPAQFLPPGARIKVRSTSVPVPAGPDLWRPVHGFLERFLKPGGRPSTAPPLGVVDVVEVKG